MVLMVSLSSRISPRTSTVIFFDKSPLATAVVFFMLRRPARSTLFPYAALFRAADFARHARHFAGEGVELVHHGVDGVLELENFAAHVHGDLLRQVAVGDRCRFFHATATSEIYPLPLRGALPSCRLRAPRASLRRRRR